MNAPEITPSVGGGPAAATQQRRPLHMWIVAIVALHWYGASVVDYLLTVGANAAYLSQFTAEQIAYVTGFPLWVDIGWAFAVWGGFVGAVLLLFRSKRAATAFAASILGMAATSTWQFALAPSRPAELMETAAIVVTALLWVMALGLFAYAIDMRRRGVLR